MDEDAIPFLTTVLVLLMSTAFLWYFCCHNLKKKPLSIQLQSSTREIEQKILRQQLIDARVLFTDMIMKHHCGPLLLRLAWSDAATYDQNHNNWPYCGGVNGSIRIEQELSYKGNEGLSKACAYIEVIKTQYPLVSWADLIQMGGALAVKLTGGPHIQIKYGRIDAISNNKNTDTLVKSTRLPCFDYPFSDQALTPSIHVRNAFSRLGFTNIETVALMGAHTIGRGFKDRTGVCENLTGDQGATQYTMQKSAARGPNSKGGLGMAGGKSWTKHWLLFDNSYFHHKEDEPDSELLWLLTDDALLQCPEYRPHFIKFAKNQDSFFLAYTSAHKKLSELGAKFDPPEGIYID
jgi:L-ascorbate peroxidase